MPDVTGRALALRCLALLAAVPALAAAQDAVPRLERVTCDFPLHYRLPQDLDRECGHLIVPEVYGRMSGRVFRLAVVVYRAKDPDGSPPLLLLHGGPGGLGGTRFPWSELQFPLARRRDVVTFDMRGVGASEPRLCPGFDGDSAPPFSFRARPDWEAAYRARVRACVASLDAQGLDRSAYGADVNAADAVALRRALGHAAWDLYGVSYGGLVAQELLRRDSSAVRAAVLVSTVAPGPEFAAENALAKQRILDAVVAGCRTQPDCAEAFPTVEADVNALYHEFTGSPVEVPVLGASPPRSVWMNGDRFMLELRRRLGRPVALAQLPRLVHELRRGGDRAAALRRLVGAGAISVWDALTHLVQCNEYGAGYPAAVAAVRPRLRPLFQVTADDFREHCDLWLPQAERQADLHPAASEVPVLVLHGEFDGFDVPATQRRITAKLRRAYTVVFPGEGHAGPPRGCHGRIVMQFLENPAREPDTSCLTGMPRLRFETRPSGP